MTLDVAAVYSHIPANLRMPGEVNRDGEQGITQATYDKIVGDSLVELEAQLDMLGVPEELRQHPLLVSYMELVSAARITRRLRIHQETADSLFADANIRLRLFLERHGYDAERSYGETVQPDDTDDTLLPSIEDWTYGFTG